MVSWQVLSQLQQFATANKAAANTSYPSHFAHVELCCVFGKAAGVPAMTDISQAGCNMWGKAKRTASSCLPHSRAAFLNIPPKNFCLYITDQNTAHGHIQSPCGGRQSEGVPWALWKWADKHDVPRYSKEVVGIIQAVPSCCGFLKVPFPQTVTKYEV